MTLTRAIHKVQLRAGGPTPIPYAARVLSVGLQDQQLTCWYITTTPIALPAERELQCVGTDWLLPDACTHETFVGTIVANSFVWHVFDPQRPYT